MKETLEQTELFDEVETNPIYSHDLWEWKGELRLTAGDLMNALRKCGEAMKVLNALGIDFTVNGKPVRIKSNVHPDDIVNIIWMNTKYANGIKEGFELKTLTFTPDEFQSVRGAFINQEFTVSVANRRDGRITVKTAQAIVHTK